MISITLHYLLFYPNLKLWPISLWMNNLKLTMTKSSLIIMLESFREKHSYENI